MIALILEGLCVYMYACAICAHVRLCVYMHACAICAHVHMLLGALELRVWAVSVSSRRGIFITLSCRFLSLFALLPCRAGARSGTP